MVGLPVGSLSFSVKRTGENRIDVGVLSGQVFFHSILYPYEVRPSEIAMTNYSLIRDLDHCHSTMFCRSDQLRYPRKQFDTIRIAEILFFFNHHAVAIKE